MRAATRRTLWRCIVLALSATALHAALLPSVHAQGLVALNVDAGHPHDDETEIRFARCFADAFSPPPALGRDAPAAALRDALFPWLEPGLVPTTAEAFSALLETKLVRERLSALGVRYIVVLQGGATGSVSTGEIYGIPYAGFFGSMKERHHYSLNAAVWDVGERSMRGSGRAGWSTTFGMVAFVFPLPVYSSTESQACNEIVKAVREAIGERR